MITIYLLPKKVARCCFEEGCIHKILPEKRQNLFAFRSVAGEKTVFRTANDRYASKIKKTRCDFLMAVSKRVP